MVSKGDLAGGITKRRAPQGGRRRAALAACLMACIAPGGMISGAGQAEAADPTVTVFNNVLSAKKYRDIPGASVQIAAEPGQRFVLHASRFSLTLDQRLPSGKNLGTTTGLFCPSADGPRPNGTHYGTNFAPGVNDRITPVVRWVFQAPHRSGTRTYTCRVAVAFYTGPSLVGRYDARVTSPTASVRLHAEDAYAGMEQWVLPPSADPRQNVWGVVRRGATATVLEHRIEPASSRTRIAVRQDAQLTMCKPQSSYETCRGLGSAAYSDVSSRVEAQPLYMGGGICGTPLRGPVSSVRISTHEHHRTMPNGLEVNKAALPRGCERLLLSLKVRVRGGSAVLVHGGSASAGPVSTAYSHGYAYEYSPTDPVPGDR
ncbi:hypothetical protein ACIRU3_36880 [Streptomyces sp. NPDC101151]|uniref:hypothetical protein n=1 Tax=Streptomyces sp. NPDC101151 TaxID=3366115 RepID=UPI00382D48F4